MYNGSRISILILLLMAVCCHGQDSNRSVFKLLESSAPLPGGGTVVSRLAPGGERTTTVTGDARLANGGSVRDSQTQLTQQQQIELQRPAAQTQSGAQTLPSTRPTYAYPVASNARVASLSSASRPNALASYPAIRARRTAQTNDLVIPTLGISSPDPTNATSNRISQTTAIPRTTARVAENCCCNPTAAPQSNLSVTGVSVPAYDPNAALTAPSLSIEPPVGAAQSGGFNFQTPNIGVPQFNNSNRTWTPFASGASAYQPLVRLVNMQPGTFLGQGVIGQPTAYVDGQPIRNLFRYLLPL